MLPGVAQSHLPLLSVPLAPVLLPHLLVSVIPPTTGPLHMLFIFLINK